MSDLKRWLYCALSAALMWPSVAVAQPPLAGWLDRTRLTGDWGGVRTALEAVGIEVSAHYQSETAGNPSGGNDQAVRYTQQLDFGVVLDLGRLADIDGGRIQIVLTDRAGRSLTNDAIGNIFSVQQLYGAGQNLRLAELNYQQTLLDGRVNFQLGWSPLGDNFATNPYACHFQNNGICGKPIGLAQDSGGARNFPVGQWGARLKLAPIPDVYAATGVYQVNPRLSDSDYGFYLGFKHDTGFIVPLEFGWLPGRDADGLPGQYKIGAYYNSSDAPDVLRDKNGASAGRTRAQHSSRTGFYLLGTQMVFRERPGSDRGLTLFGTFAMGDPHVAQFGRSWAVGANYQGSVAGRDHDFLALVFASAQINPRLTRFQRDRNTVAPGSIGVQTYERFAEIDYSAQLTPWLALRPNLQYIIRPGGTGKIPDAFVIGLDMLVTF
jgi:porin